MTLRGDTVDACVWGMTKMAFQMKGKGLIFQYFSFFQDLGFYGGLLMLT